MDVYDIHVKRYDDMRKSQGAIFFSRFMKRSVDIFHMNPIRIGRK